MVLNLFLTHLPMAGADKDGHVVMLFFDDPHPNNGIFI
jgi:hypothetical protein